MAGERLFGEFDSYSAIEHQKKQLKEDLRKISEPELKGTDIEGWVQHFKDKYEVTVPTLDRSGIEGDVQDVQLNARHFRSQFHFDDGDSGFIPTPGTEVRFYVPFTGDAEVFRCSGNTMYATFPSAHVGEGRLSFSYQTVDHDANTINANFERDLNTIEGHLRGLETAFRELNQAIEPMVRQELSTRLAKFMKDAELASSLKYPLKKREGAPATYKVPEIKRTAAPRPLPAAKAVTPQDPALELEHYDHIIGVVRNMVRVMECSPNAFKALDEEALRFHFLVQLNGQYEGMATGETFNFQGKTDILIKYNGQNLFIAECKFWKGPKGYSETIDQLLKYVTWRDTKTAIFVFCKDVDPSIPVNKIPEETQKHPSFLRAVPFGDGSSFRYVLKHPSDATKELFLTVMVFNIPR